MADLLAEFQSVISKEETLLGRVVQFSDIKIINSADKLEIPGEPFSSSISPIGLMIRFTLINDQYALLRPQARFYPGLIDKFEKLNKQLKNYDRGDKDERELYLEVLNLMLIELGEIKARLFYRANVEESISTEETTLEEEAEAAEIVKKYERDLSKRNKE